MTATPRLWPKLCGEPVADSAMCSAQPSALASAPELSSIATSIMAELAPPLRAVTTPSIIAALAAIVGSWAASRFWLLDPPSPAELPTKYCKKDQGRQSELLQSWNWPGAR